MAVSNEFFDALNVDREHIKQRLSEVVTERDTLISALRECVVALEGALHTVDTYCGHGWNKDSLRAEWENSKTNSKSALSKYER